MITAAHALRRTCAATLQYDAYSTSSAPTASASASFALVAVEVAEHLCFDVQHLIKTAVNVITKCSVSKQKMIEFGRDCRADRRIEFGRMLGAEGRRRKQSERAFRRRTFAHLD